MFVKGQGKVGGRKPGVKNKRTLELAKLCAKLTLDNPKFVKQLQDMIDKDFTQIDTPLLLRLIDYGYGQPQKRVELSAPGGGPIEVVSPDFGAPSRYQQPAARGNGGRNGSPSTTTPSNGRRTRR